MVLVISIFKWVLYSTALASLLSIIILAFKFLIKDKSGVRWHYAIWLIVVIRLLIPYGLESSLSIFNIVNFKSTTVIQVPSSINNKVIKIFNNKESNTNETTNLAKTNLQPNTSNFNQRPIYLQFISCLWLMVAILIGSYTIVMTMKLKARFKKGHECENDYLFITMACYDIFI